MCGYKSDCIHFYRTPSFRDAIGWDRPVQKKLNTTFKEQLTFTRFRAIDTHVVHMTRDQYATAHRKEHTNDLNTILNGMP